MTSSILARGALAAAVGTAVLVAGCGPAAVVGTGAAVATSVRQERSTIDGLTDAEVALGIQTRLGNRSGALYRDVFVDVVEQNVVLTGSVESTEDRIAAVEAAWATPGVRSVADEMTVGNDSGAQAYWRDVKISNALRYALLTDLSVRDINYTVTTVDGTVHLTGLARSKEELERVVGHARRTPGVDRVVSHVRTIDDPSRVNRAARSG